MLVSLPKVTISSEALEEFRLYTKWATGEVSALGLIEERPDGIHVPQIFLLEQKCCSVETELDGQAIARLIYELELKGIDSSKLRYWIHSHANMQVFWSGTDEGTIRDFGKSAPYFLSTVVNKKGQSKTRLDLYEPFRVTIDELEFIEERVNNPEWESLLKSQFETLVKPAYTAPTKSLWYSKSKFNTVGGVVLCKKERKRQEKERRALLGKGSDTVLSSDIPDDDENEFQYSIEEIEDVKASFEGTGVVEIVDAYKRGTLDYEDLEIELSYWGVEPEMFGIDPPKGRHAFDDDFGYYSQRNWD